MGKAEILPRPPSNYNDTERFLHYEQGGLLGGRLPQYDGISFWSPARNTFPAVTPATTITPFDITRKAFRLRYVRDQVAKSAKAGGARKHFTTDDGRERIDDQGRSLSETKYRDVSGVVGANVGSDWNAANMARKVSASRCAFRKECPFYKDGDCSEGLLVFLENISPAEREHFGNVMERVHSLGGTHDVECVQATEGLAKLKSKDILPRLRRE